MISTAASRNAVPENSPFRARVHFATETLHVNRGDALAPTYEEATLPVLQLRFDYPWGAVRASDENDRVFVPAGATVLSAERDLRAEGRICMAIEALGGVEVDASDAIADLDSEADYLLGNEEDAGHFCRFTRHAIEALGAQGIEVSVADDYPYQFVQPAPRWYADLQESEQKPDWFGLELGVEVRGERVNLVPVLLSLLDRAGQLRSLEALRMEARRLTVVPVGDRFIEMSPELLESLWCVLVELYESGSPSGSRLEFSKLLAAALGQIAPAVRASGARMRWYGDRRARDEATRVVAPPVSLSNEDLDVQATLRPYQLEGVAWLQHLSSQGLSGVLADDMGLGKTLQTIAHLVQEKASGRAQAPSLVLCPTSLVGNWARELKRFAPDLKAVVYHGPQRHHAEPRLAKADVVITTYPVLLRDVQMLEQRDWYMLILDEAQAIKSRHSHVHGAVKSLPSTLRLALSGTPVENNLGELWALFDFVLPGLLGEHGEFRSRFSDQAVRLGDELRLQALREMVSPYILRRTKEQVAKDLPSKTHVVVPVELTGKQRDLYESIRCAAHQDVRQAIAKRGLPGSTIAILDALMKLRQLCCDPRLVKLDAARFVRESAKFEVFMKRLEEHLGQGRRVLVFSQFTQMLGLIGEGLQRRNIDFLSLTGNSRDRQGLVDSFEQGLADVFLISLKAGGTGLNLTSADTVIHYDPWWNPAAQDQATDRAYRIGQNKPVIVEQFVCAGSVEQRMLALQDQKRELAAAILGDTAPEAVGLSQEDVDDLFAPLPEA